ncbi:TetR/AcrR family transcriptional regulator [Streptomyces albidoflavus]|jgi:AcrR family transcriptional regulator|uniref:TetR/AcrR family transcriptional regulator n=1 Tax=Streptomyces albidoflavus TaxID=1886 RepID=UPI0004C146FF|nr:TetR/AcrR family transcriptional regulator [Streptomyces albidoflavus]AMM07644.1 TetR-family transcriptional regulator [Streptomyces albidoflavus]RZE28155.1 TetR/AcrR family transcriptional regulator [Streptomyces albidoflavus]RZE48286.1 TetR/AcrR family transcriptional regulator [Streptomyces albidoflavus]RZE50551.1 TetR/AcrR family transcriptional regulator [Streptomyces albidoflavus]RZE67635.1 TetR/AcrR family transcriptional regulator [Streptomyces albidoflavus]
MTSTAGRPGRVARLPPRERILDAAEELFQSEGIRRVSVQAIAEKAATTKMAIYRHFETKDALVAEWMRIVAADYQAAFDRVEAEHPGRPREQIVGLARFIAEGLPALSHRGCPFINSLAELPDRSHPARQVIEEHKAHQTRRLVGMCAEAGLPDPGQAAAEITFVLEGAQVSTQNGSIDRAGERLMSIVEGIVDRHGSPLDAPRPAVG